MKKIYSIICIIIDTVVLFFVLNAALYGITEKKELLIGVPLIVMCVIILSITLNTFVKMIKKSKEHIIRNSILMKLSVFFLCTAISFLGVPDGIYAFSVFLALGGIFTTAAILYIRVNYDVNLFPKANQYRNDYSFNYKGKWGWESAAKEYMRLHHIINISDLSDNDGYKIYDYTVVPLSYFFYWLAESGFLTESFYEDYPGVNEMIEEMLKRKNTPVEVLSALDYYFSSDYMLDGIKPFFRSYFDHNGKFTNYNNYLYDYYEANGNPEDRYYCIDFSWEVQDKLTAKIEEREEHWEHELNINSDREFYDDEPIGKSVNSTLFNADMDAVKSGIRYSGFPNDDVYEYLDRCLKSLDSLSSIQIKRLERFFEDTYGVREITEVTFVNSFKAETLHILEPKYDSDVVFVVSGSAGFESEHGISFTVRNGQIIDWGYSYDFDDVYSTKNIKQYEIAPDIDFTAIKNEADAEKYVTSGKLVKTRLLPDILGCVFKADEEEIYLTPRSLLEKEKLEKRIRNIRAYSNMDSIGILYVPKYEENNEHERQSIVPRDLYIRTAGDNDQIKISFHIKIWF